MQTLSLAIATAITFAAAGCVTEDPEDPAEDLGPLDGKADKITTRNVTLRPRLSSGRPSRRSYKVTTAHAFRVSLAYDAAATTHLTVLDGADVIAESPDTWQPTLVVPEAAAPRALTIRIENATDAAVTVRLHAATPDGRTLRVATFNIRWYGIGGDIDAPKPETRNPALRAFLAEHLADRDLIMFEEITDVAMLRAELAPAGWTCDSYASNAPKHQFVVACHAPSLYLTHEADDDDVAYQPLAMGSLRPAVTGVLRDAATGAPLARLTGVHLKALPDSTEKRLAQAKILADRLDALAALNEQLPAIVLGDFNSHRAVDTGRDRDDWVLMADVLGPAGLARVDYPFENTYRDRVGKAFKLDHIWLGGAQASAVDVIGPCNLSWETDQATIEKHFDEISDHCPVVATVALP